MIKKYHNQTLQTTPRHPEEEPQNIYSNKARKTIKAKLFLYEMNEKLERTQSNAYQKQRQTQNPHKQWKHTLNNRSTTTVLITRLRTVSSLSYRGGGGLNAFKWRKIFTLESVVVKTQNCLARMVAS